MHEITNKDFIAKAYTTPDGKFLKVENKNGAIYTIWEHPNRHIGGYVISQPIVPNHTTGSSLYVAGGQWESITLEQVLEIIENGVNRFPAFFTPKDIEATKFFPSIESAVNQHGNILQFKKIK